MSQDQYIFPQEILENTAEFHFHAHRSSSGVIYRIILLALIFGFAGLYFLKVDINVKSSGVIRTLAEHNDIKPLISGRIASVLVTENKQVKAGDVLLTIERESLDGKNDMVNLQQTDVRAEMHDLALLSAAYQQNNWSKALPLKSGIYTQQYNLFKQRIAEARSRYELANKNYQRYLKLYTLKVVSATEYEDMKLKLDNVSNELLLISKDQGSKWQTELSELKIKNTEFNSQNEVYAEEKQLYTIKATISGAVQQLKGLQKGSFVSANELLGTISPDSGLIAETYVLPKDIGLLKVGTKAKFQVDAYSYNQWGMVTGKITSISSDVYTDNGRQPYFKVRCVLDKYQLKLKNGYVGNLKKGMTMQARFFVTRRTLFELLYDKADDWLNPNVNASPTT